MSVLDLVERFPSVALPFSTFLSLLPPMRVRQYSIASSPLGNPSVSALAYSVLAGPALADPRRNHAGVASSYLASLIPGDKVRVAVRRAHAAFRLPSFADGDIDEKPQEDQEQPERTPIIMVAAGAGLAPFRGFVQERAARIAAGQQLAPAMLFFGCRSPHADNLYRDELDRWEAMGAVTVRRAFSRVDRTDEAAVADACGCKHVQDRLWHDRDELMKLWDQGAKMYVCGSRAIGESVKMVVLRIAVEKQRLRVERGESDEEPDEEAAVRWFDSLRNKRYAVDLFD